MGKFEYSPNFEALSERIRIAARPLRRAQLQCLDFENACALAEPGDTVYLDPPYSVSHEGNGFLRYNERVFSWDDQKRLALLAAQLASKACRIVISNANHPSIIALYPGFEKTVVCRRSLVAGVVTSRKGVTELVISNFVCLHPAFVTAFNKALQVRQ
jgi:DNA adenine methylase